MAVIKLQDELGRKMHYHYEVDTASRPLGSGGMGQVMRAIRINDDNGATQEVAIKFLYDDLAPSIIARARKEASIQIHHENLVEMLGFMEFDEVVSNHRVKRYHVISELLRGVRLLDFLNGTITDYEGKPVAYAQELMQRYENDWEGVSVEIVTSVLSGIMALHDYGYIHRDIDPSNIMITSDHKIKLIDYGLAKKKDYSMSVGTEEQLTHAGQFVGKVGYAAPELVSGDIQDQNVTTDLYALGILLYRLVVGELPFTGSNAEVMAKQLQENVPVENVHNKRLRKIIEKATQKRQADRYQSAAEFRVDLEHLGRSESSSEEVPTLEEAPTSNTVTHRNKSNMWKDVALWGSVIVVGGALGCLIRLLI